MAGLVKNECYKVLRQGKCFLFMGAVLVLQILKIYQARFTPRTEDGAEPGGQSFPLHMIGAQSFVMALFAAVLAADLMAEEFRSGTLKLILLRPVDRRRIVAAKATALVAAVAALTGFSAAAAYVTGTLAFGWGDGGSVAATVAAAVASIGPYAGFGMLLLFVALLTEHAGMTIGIAAALYLFSPLFGIPPEYSIVHLMNTFHVTVARAASFGDILPGLGVIAAYVVFFHAAGVILIKQKDVLL